MSGKAFTFPGTGTTVPRAVLFAIDDYSLPLKKNLCYYLSKPDVRPEPVLTPSRDNPNAPDFVAIHFYGTVLHDGGRFRMWYYACGLGEKQGEIQEGPICYAESGDGIHWVKPNLGQVLYKGSTNNNAILLPDKRTEGVEILKEDDDPDPQRRYKAVYESFPASVKFPTQGTATSPDGLHWTKGPEVTVNVAMEQSSFYKFNGTYYVNAQIPQRGEGGRRRMRTGYVTVSPDFVNWLEEFGESFALPEPANPDDIRTKPTDQVHLGVGAASMGNVLIGLYCIWHNRPLPTPGDWFGQGTTSGDLGLLVSNDGIHFREPVKGFVYIAKEDSPATPAPDEAFPTILEQCHGILNVGDETRIYHGRWRNARYVNPTIPVAKEHEASYYRNDYWAEVGLATLPRDRWGALGLFPDATEGSVWTAPVTLPAGGFGMALNADAADGMRVEIADERFALLPQFSSEQSGTVTALENAAAFSPAGGFDCPVTWRASVAALGGQTVRFRIHLKKQGEATPRLYAVYLK